MKNHYIKILLVSFFISACGGGGGGSSLELTVEPFSSFSVNEDDIYETVISSSTNKPSTISYTISKPSPNANVTVSDSGNLFYAPRPDFFGNDTFSITIIATPQGDNGTYQSKTLNINANVISVNDVPQIVINDDLSIYNEGTLIFDDFVTINVTVTDVDNTMSQLEIFGKIDNEEFPGNFSENLSTPGTGSVDISVSANQNAGLHFMDICVSDGSDTTCGGQMQAYFPGNRQIKSVDYWDSTGNNCSTSDQYL